MCLPVSLYSSLFPVAANGYLSVTSCRATITDSINSFHFKKWTTLGSSHGFQCHPLFAALQWGLVNNKRLASPLKGNTHALCTIKCTPHTPDSLSPLIPLTLSHLSHPPTLPLPLSMDPLLPPTLPLHLLLSNPPLPFPLAHFIFCTNTHNCFFFICMFFSLSKCYCMNIRVRSGWEYLLLQNFLV